jgi:hypothetical protein
MTDVPDLVRRSREASTREAFERRVDEQAATLRADLRAGELDSEAFTLGLELEVYTIDSENRLAALPDGALEVCTKEIGVHNAELNVSPTLFDGRGIAEQADELCERFAAAREAVRADGRDLVLDALWTIPPVEGTREYLGAVRERGGAVIASNMRTDARYHALDNDVLDPVSTVSASVPGADLRVPTVFLESLATSMQPHFLVPAVEEFPRYFNAAIRTLGPLLALGTNAPFLPADCYDLGEHDDGSDDENGGGTNGGNRIDPLDVIDRAPHELRIPIFEESMNVDSPGKVRVPRDLADAEGIVSRLLDDRVCAPFLREWIADTGAETDVAAETVGNAEASVTAGDSAEGKGYASGLWELDYKRSSYWRWVRPVFGGTPVEGACDERSLRVEYRPLPTQPSLEDVTGLSVLFAGLLRGLVVTDHPVLSLPWEAARDSFYDVVEQGFEADLAWVGQDGERVSEVEAVYEDLFAVARRGLAEQGVSEAVADRHLRPIEARVEARTAPSDWKKRAVRERIEAGETLETAIEGMQHEYIERTETPFAEWL